MLARVHPEPGPRGESVRCVYSSSGPLVCQNHAGIHKDVLNPRFKEAFELRNQAEVERLQLTHQLEDLQLRAEPMDSSTGSVQTGEAEPAPPFRSIWVG